MMTYSKIQKDYTKNVMGYSALGIILSTCLGSVAVMSTLSLGHGLLQMVVVTVAVMVCGLHNAAILTVQKPALIFKILTVSTILSTLIILIASLV